MPLFQKSVLNKYLKEQGPETVLNAYQTFRKYFHDPAIQQNIINSKEEQFQEGFLRELFVKVFGYVLNPSPDFNLTTEFKNEKGAQKADGAILKEGKAVGVIELKSTKTKDLETVRKQAFDYKANQSACTYVITSNFQKLRFYINDAVEFEEFDLFILSRERFEVLFLCLNHENLLADLPLKIKNASILEEEKITKKFYADYSTFKKELFEDIASRNEGMAGVTKLMLYKKTQKLLDRFLFIFFAEDRGLLPPNSISRMIKRWKVLEEEDAYKPLYDIYKQYFGYLNKGRKGKIPGDDIHEYNGGLFLQDEILDKIEIDDDVLYQHTTTLTNYDFDSQVDVNILGHIFEHSLNEIESTTAELEGVDFDKQKSKRKKDGVFYTPKYITKYIVDNTVGKLCEEKKAELGIVDEAYTPNRQKETKKKLLVKLETYRSWLLELTICDPACGSGAFLNQALEFLITEHHYIDELNAKLFGSVMVFQDVENQILENNLFGVDINEESVEIARLSLWLRTAQRGRKLTTLNKNIKCGNSLIDDPEAAGEKAFNWQQEFPEIFAKGGFDVVIGNPPYGMVTSESNKEFYQKHYNTPEGRFDLFELFIERSFLLLHNKGYFSFIIPNTLLSNLYSRKLRKYIIDNMCLNEITNFGMNVFDDPTVHTCIFQISKDIGDNKIVNIRRQVDSPDELSFDFDYSINQDDFLKTENITFDIFFNPSEKEVLHKLEANVSLGSICYIRQCIKTGNDKIYVQNSETEMSHPWKSSLRGKGIGRYLTKEKNLYLKYGDWLARNWKNQTFYETPKIVIRETGSRIIATLDVDNHYLLSSLYSIYPKTEVTMHYLKSLLALLNSKPATYYIKKIAYELTKGAFTKVRTNQLARLPIPNIEFPEQEKISYFVDEILIKNDKFDKVSHTFLKYLKSKFSIEVFSKKLQNWHELEFGEFIKELYTAIKKAGGERLSKMDEMDWMEVFETKKTEIQILKVEIDKIDKEIDRMVYELYGLMEEEIKIVEQY